MDNFTFKLTQRQHDFLHHILPKGYSLSKVSKKVTRTHLSDPHQTNKEDQTPNSESQPISSHHSHSNQLHSKDNQKTKHSSKSTKKSAPSTISQTKKSKAQTLNKNPNHSQKLKLLTTILDEIEKKKSSAIFIEPVDPVKLQIPTYFEIIKQPMDLQTMRKNVKKNNYRSFESFNKDMGKISDNCIKFNAGNDYFVKIAQKFSKQCQQVIRKYKRKIQELFKNESQSQRSQSAELNSEEETNSQEEIKNTTKIRKDKVINIKTKKQSKKQEHKQDQKKEETKNDQRVKKQAQNYKDQKSIIEEKQQQNKDGSEKEEKFESKQESQDQRIQKKQSSQRKSTKVKSSKSSKIKKYSYNDRLDLLSRIKKLDRGTMADFFKEINFSKGQSLDFKVLEDEKIHQIATKLKHFEIIHEQKLKKIQQETNFLKAKEQNEQDFEIESDKDYED